MMKKPYGPQSTGFLLLGKLSILWASSCVVVVVVEDEMKKKGEGAGVFEIRRKILLKLLDFSAMKS